MTQTQTHDLYLFNIIDVESNPCITLIGTFAKFSDGFEAAMQHIQNGFNACNEETKNKVMDYFRASKRFLAAGGTVQEQEWRTVTLQVVCINFSTIMSSLPTLPVPIEKIQEHVPFVQKKRRRDVKD